MQLQLLRVHAVLHGCAEVVTAHAACDNRATKVIDAAGAPTIVAGACAQRSATERPPTDSASRCAHRTQRVTRHLSGGRGSVAAAQDG